MIELIFLAILLISLFGIGIILFKKIPALAELSASSKKLPESLSLKIRKVIGQLPGAKKFDYELYLQKILSRIRIITLKTESKTGSWLEKLRQRSNQRNNHNNDPYWEELKKAKNGK